MADDQGNNLLNPGKTPQDNIQFLVFLVATIRAVYYHADILRAAVASSGNDHSSERTKHRRRSFRSFSVNSSAEYSKISRKES